jgi:glycosyltransferase involved in cell wall biosynthesis
VSLQESHVVNNGKNTLLSIVVPLCNEEQVIPLLRKRLLALRDSVADPVELILVDDGSSDATPLLLDKFAEDVEDVKAVHLSRNFGHQQAVSAGLSLAKGDNVAIIDGDLQDPPEEIIRFLRKLDEGYDVVYAVRRDRKEGWLKRAAYAVFYRLLSRLATIDIPLDTGDFCVMRRVVVEQINAMPERHRFIRGLRCYAGFRQTGVAYVRDARAAGAPKYTFWKLLELATDGIFTFSAKPLRLATVLGFCSAVAALAYSAYIIMWRLLSSEELPGFASIIAVVLYLGAVQLVCIGILGEYIGRIHNEVKRRPGYIIARIAERNSHAEKR